MSRKQTTEPTDAPVNGRVSPNDGPTLQDKASTSFDPADLERSTVGSDPPGPDPFDPASLRLSQSLSTVIGVKKALLSVPVRKPDRSWFVRVHPSEHYRLQTAVIELKEDRETYLVAP